MDEFDPCYYDFDDRDDQERDEDDALANCSRMSDGWCGQAGSEYCEFECPFR